MKKTGLITIGLVGWLIFAAKLSADQSSDQSVMANLKNYQVNSPTMMSAGLPNKAQFEFLKTLGVTKVVDLIPGNRTQEAALVSSLGLTYFNIAVDWENPTIENFQQYILAMRSSKKSEQITLTHCKLNWRGAVFTYLYRVTQLNESDAVAKQDMLAIWNPNSTWQNFIEQVKAEYPINTI